MKTAVLAFFFLFAISTTLPSASATDFVFDTDGDQVQNGLPYYIISETGHGLEIAQLANDKNPVSVIQSSTNYSNGLPLRPSSPILLLYITTDMRLNINFVGVRYGYWEVVDNSVKIYRQMELVGPFKIGTHKEGMYKILYVSNDTPTPLRVSKSNRNLNLDEGPLLTVKFKKAFTNSLGRNIA